MPIFDSVYFNRFSTTESTESWVKADRYEYCDEYYKENKEDVTKH